MDNVSGYFLSACRIMQATVCKSLVWWDKCFGLFRGTERVNHNRRPCKNVGRKDDLVTYLGNIGPIIQAHDTTGNGVFLAAQSLAVSALTANISILPLSRSHRWTDIQSDRNVFKTFVKYIISTISRYAAISNKTRQERSRIQQMNVFPLSL